MGQSNPESLIRAKKEQGDQEIILNLLERIADDSEITQAGFATQMGIAKGLANFYFNRCLSTGWIKLKHVPRRRYLYYLTPKGFSEKARLTALFLAHSYKFYRDARADLLSTLEEVAHDGHARVMLVGPSELAEIALVVSAASRIEIAGIVAANGAHSGIAKRVCDSAAEIPDCNAALLTAIDQAKETYTEFRRAHPEIHLYVPRQLKPLVGV